MFVVRHRIIFFLITGALTLAAIAALVFWTPQLSIDFTGGSLVDVNYTSARPDLATLRAALTSAGMKDASVRESGTSGLAIRTHTLTPEEHNTVLSALSLNGAATLTEDRFTSIGPSLGSELSTKALYAMLAVIAAIVLYIAWAFRKVSKPVSSWVYGLTVIAILVHDILIPAGFYAVLAHFTGVQVDTLFVVALLAILGYSVNDTIVIFDRVREHLGRNEKSGTKQPFEEVVGRSITETLGRSINTSLTVVLALLALAFFGSSVTVDFALVLLAGVVAGTYSSILLAAPLLVPLSKVFAKH
ncbi:MAG: Protein-export rane protein SecF [Parcubacteria group bacterium]|nr:Protein-export rane protein SecF [Parcubacteria group bacterium]